MPRHVIASLAALVSLASCSREAPPPPAPTTAVDTTTNGHAQARPAPTTASPPPASTSRCTAPLPAPDMVRDNIAETGLSGIAEVVSVSRTAADGKSPAPSSGYVTLHYEVSVLEWLAGRGTKDRLVLLQRAEADSPPLTPGRLLLFSACALPDGSAYEPDVGYFFPIDPACRSDAEELARRAATRAHGGRQPKPRACEPLKH